MKLKAVVAKGTSQELVDEFNNLRGYVLDSVVGRYLHRPQMGPAGFYVQECDFADPSGGLLCEVRLTGVSRTRDRSEADFESARDELEKIYRSCIEHLLYEGEEVELMVTVMVDGPPSLFETEPVMVQGRKIKRD